MLQSIDASKNITQLKIRAIIACPSVNSLYSITLNHYGCVMGKQLTQAG